MTAAVWSDLLRETAAVYHAHDDLTAFAPFPTDLRAQSVVPHAIPSMRLLMAETGLQDTISAPLCEAVVAAAPIARWRETYKGTGIGQDFLDRFGCYSLIGSGGAYHSSTLWAWIVYMPARLHYTWHHHPGEEIYAVLAGQAEFMRAGEAGAVLRPGETSFHASNQPHAMTTHDHPVLCLVVWRNGFDTLPVLTPQGAAA